MANQSSVSFGQKLAAEGLGTGFLLAAIVGSGIMAAKLSGGNVAVALLANAIAAWWIVNLLAPSDRNA